MRSIPLGPFDLFEPIGRGGMGEVWRGVHRAQDVPVAVKVLTAKGMRRNFFLVAFRNEVRAMAGLDHPGIALVFDHGEVSEESAVISEGLLVAGSPYLAMELAHGGTLGPWCGRLAWVECREVMLGLLDALAHAHARGVIHRDLKPANVLICTEQDLRPGIKLTDFGLAHLPELTERVAGRGPTAGTPHYMAPEQVQGRRREYGPWTDLYSLGRLALALVWGNPAPTSGKDSPGTTLPVGFDAWVARLLQREPEDRFQRAADAALALLSLPDAPAEPEDQTDRPRHALRLGIAAETFALTGVESSVSRSFASAQTSVSDTGAPTAQGGVTPITPAPHTPISAPTPISSGAPHSSGSASSHSGPSAAPLRDAALGDQSVEPCERETPPMPPSWRRPNPPAPAMRLVGAGLGIYGLRAIPLVDREDERDLLWGALHAVRDEGKARAVTLVGPAGCGKSRLAEWLCERAHEVGAVAVLRAAHAPLSGPGDGLAPMLARALRCQDQERARVVQRVEVTLRRQGVKDPEEWHALTELICPATASDLEPGVQAIQFSGPGERWSLVGRMLGRMAAERPVLVWLDDVQWGLDTLGFARHMLLAQQDDPRPVLLVLTSQDEALAERTAETDALDSLLEVPGATRVNVGPLPPESHAALVRGLLGLEGELAASVEARTAGNPMFAVQLVGDWVFRGLLEPAETGFRLKPGARADLPDLLHKVWAGRAEAVLRGRPAGQGVALELAAVLGQEVLGSEWRVACGLEGVDASVDLVDELLEQRLARCPDGRPEEAWSFVHGMLRESLERRARETGRWWAHHRACATMLYRRLAGADGAVPRGLEARLAERLGRHLLAAGDLEEALAPLVLGAKDRYSTGEYAHASMLVSDWDRAITRLQLRPDDPRWGEGWMLRASLCRSMGRIEEAQAWTSRALEASTAFGWTRIEAEAWLERGKLAFVLGEAGEVVRLLRASEERAAAIGDRTLLGKARLDLANFLRIRGELPAAITYLRQAQIEFQAIGDAVNEAYCHLGLGVVARAEGRLADARKELEQSFIRFERAGSRRGMADALNALGETDRLQGDLPRAEERYRAALVHFRAVDSPQTFAPECNLALVLVGRGRYPEARRVLEGLLPAVERGGRRVYRGNLHAYLLPSLAAAGDWSAFMDHLALANSLLSETRIVDEDIPRLASLAATLALEADQVDAAKGAWQLALDQWQKLNRPPEAAAARRALRGLP